MTLDQDTEIELKRYEGLNNYNLCIMSINANPQIDPVLIATQNQGSQDQVGNQDTNVPKQK